MGCRRRWCRPLLEDRQWQQPPPACQSNHPPPAARLLQIYDIATDSWSAGAQMPEAADHLDQYAHDGRIGVLGGRRHFRCAPCSPAPTPRDVALPPSLVHAGGWRGPMRCPTAVHTSRQRPWRVQGPWHRRLPDGAPPSDIARRDVSQPKGLPFDVEHYVVQSQLHALYDPAPNSWEVRAPLPVARGSVNAAMIQRPGGCTTTLLHGAHGTCTAPARRCGLQRVAATVALLPGGLQRCAGSLVSQRVAAGGGGGSVQPRRSAEAPRRHLQAASHRSWPLRGRSTWATRASPTTRSRSTTWRMISGAPPHGEGSCARGLPIGWPAAGRGAGGAQQPLVEALPLPPPRHRPTPSSPCSGPALPVSDCAGTATTSLPA